MSGPSLERQPWEPLRGAPATRALAIAFDHGLSGDVHVLPTILGGREQHKQQWRQLLGGGSLEWARIEERSIAAVAG
jgi:hypothetical protein